MDSGPDLSLNIQLVESFAATGRSVRLAGLTGGLADLTWEWTQHVEEAEERLFPHLVARGPAADGPVGICLAEHAALSARVADLRAVQRPTPEWFREAESLIGRLIQHVFFEARLLRFLLDRAGSAYCLDKIESRGTGRGER
jgi:hypothetical protein